MKREKINPNIEQQINLEKRILNEDFVFDKSLYGRVSYFDGTRPVGWIPLETDLIFNFEDGFLSEDGIKEVDRLAAAFNKEAFVNYQFLPKGVETVIYCGLKFLIRWAGRKALDYIIKFLKDKENIESIKKINDDFSNPQSISSVNICIKDLKSYDVNIYIKNYTDIINDITEKAVDDLENQILKSNDK